MDLDDPPGPEVAGDVARLHVLGGVIWMALLLYRSQVQNVYSADNALGVELFGLYWHFVDVVWIALFTVIYLVH